VSEEDSGHAVQLRGVEYLWSRKSPFALRIGCLTVRRGERLLLLGASGSGKSTLLSLVTGIATPVRGEALALGTDLAKLGSGARDRFRAEHFGIIFQMFNLLPYGAVVDNVVLPLSFAPRRRAHALRAGGVQREAVRLLTALGLPAGIHAQAAATLSVGQQQRVAVARALIGSPEIIIADEPTSALDEDSQQAFLKLLFAQVEAAGSSLIMVSHDRRLARQFGRVVYLDELLSRPSIGIGVQ
jgi:putative ABC transport system ATP-binding protein